MAFTPAQLNTAIGRTFSMSIKNTDTANAKKLGILVGNYLNEKIKVDTATGVGTIHRNDPSLINAAGYNVAQVADDFETPENRPAADEMLTISGDARCNVRTFAEIVRTIGCKVKTIIIQARKNSSGVLLDEIFDSNLEVGQLKIGANGGQSYVNLQDYVSVDAYDRSKINIEFGDDPLVIDAETYMAINVPANADFVLKFKFAD